MASDKRLFFALWPDDRVRDQLREWQREFLPAQAWATHRDDLHMTLHFLGQVEPAQARALRSFARECAARAFDLKLDHLGHFRRARVLWAGIGQPPGELLELHEAIARRLPVLGIEPERRAYRPHVTLARKASNKPGSGPSCPIFWPVRRWALVESCPGRVPLYRPLEIWTLQENAGKQTENKLHSGTT